MISPQGWLTLKFKKTHLRDVLSCCCWYRTNLSFIVIQVTEIQTYETIIAKCSYTTKCKDNESRCTGIGAIPSTFFITV